MVLNHNQYPEFMQSLEQKGWSNKSVVLVPFVLMDSRFIFQINRFVFDVFVVKCPSCLRLPSPDARKPARELYFFAFSVLSSLPFLSDT